MRAFITSLLICASSLCLAEDGKTALQSYFDLFQKYPNTLGPDGNSSQGEIEIIRDPARIQEIAKSTGRKVGIICQDKYWLWISDAVKFPSGAYGVYNRILWKNSLNGPAGVAVMPILPNGK